MEAIKKKRLTTKKPVSTAQFTPLTVQDIMEITEFEGITEEMARNMLEQIEVFAKILVKLVLYEK